MVSKVDVFYEGWGERWLWGTLVSSTALTGRPLIAFEFSQQAVDKGLELSRIAVPLQGPRLRRDFPAHQLGLPGPVYDALPDGWGMLLMDRLFKQRGLNTARIGPLERLNCIGNSAMGAMSFVPSQSDVTTADDHVSLEQLAFEVQEVLEGEGGEFLQRLLQMGGSPQGARPKALLWRDTEDGRFFTVDGKGRDAWLVKFPAKHEHPEVCAIEAVYSLCLQECGIATPATAWFELPGGLAAFATKRFDRQNGIRVPMQSLAALTGADYRVPGALDYTSFLRATHLCTNDIRQKALAFERVVFNVIFNNRDDHPRNFAYLMSSTGQWQLAPAYDVTWCEGPDGYHQMDVMGEALDISRKQLVALGQQETELAVADIDQILARVCATASHFADKARENYPGQITPQTLTTIQTRLVENAGRFSRG